MKVVIDRFEGEFAVVEIDAEHFANLPRCLVPDAGEGDVVDISIDKAETEYRKQQAQSLMNRLFKD